MAVTGGGPGWEQGARDRLLPPQGVKLLLALEAVRSWPAMGAGTESGGEGRGTLFARGVWIPWCFAAKGGKGSDRSEHENACKGLGGLR